jgi:BatD DUF11 like domain
LSDTDTIRACMACLLAVLFTGQADAGGFSMGNSNTHPNDGYITNRPWGNVGASTPAPQYQPPQPYPPGSYYLGAAPDSGWFTPPSPVNNAVASTTPVIETELSDTTVYEQQNLIYTVRVVSDGNLAVLDHELPRNEEAILELIDGPVATSRSNGYNHPAKIVNTYRFRLMPLRAGEIRIPPIPFTGSYAANRQLNLPQGGKFSNAATSPLTLQVRAADPAVQPWLPLHDLRLHTNLQQDGPLKAGQPVTLTLELSAQGIQGNRLPSLAEQLRSPQFRVYRDSTSTTSGTSPDGRYLTGSRTETYTLIPLQDGWIRLPEINVAWWDIDSQQARLAGMPRPETSGIIANPLAASGTDDQSRSPLFWAPMGIAFALIAGYLLGAWHPIRPLFRRTGNWLGASGRRALAVTRHTGSRLAPTRLLGRLRMSIALLMPQSVKIWMCTRCLATEENPEAWCAEFKSRICQHLEIPAHFPLTRVAEHIIAVRPHTEPARLRELAHTLDGAVYGGRPLDFRAWKRELQQLLRPRLLRRARNRLRTTGSHLPALNPD